MNKNRILLATGMGIVAVLLSMVYLKEKERKFFGGAPVEILVAAMDIPRETPISEEHLAIRKIPQEFVHPHTIFPDNKEIILGQPTRYALVKNQPILWSDIGKGEGGLTGMLNPGEVAITIGVDEITGVAGNLKPSDRVNVLGTFEVGGRTITKVLLQNVTVLSVGTMIPRSENKEEVEVNMLSSMLQGPYSSVTVAVTPEEAQMLTLAREKGKLALVLRNPLDLEIREDIPEISLNSILEIEKKLTSKRKEKQIERTEIIKGGREEKEW